MTPPDHALERCSWPATLAGRLFLSLAGWRSAGAIPPGRRFVVIAAPHTSNWDYPLAIAFAWSRGLRMNALVKHTLFRGPLRPLLRWLGAIPVDRRAPGGLVAHLAEQVRSAERIALVVPPTGTRSRTPHWRSGFLHIARAAEVPLVCCTCDYSTKTVAILDSFVPTDDLTADMDRLRALYRPEQALYPALMTPVRLKVEQDGEGGS